MRLTSVLETEGSCLLCFGSNLCAYQQTRLLILDRVKGYKERRRELKASANAILNFSV